MPRLPSPREGNRLETKGRPTDFSFWPTVRKRAHAKVQPKLFALEPWGILENTLTKKCDADRKKEALACLMQAKDFYLVGTEKGIEAARPLALYYCYMNLLKVLGLMRGDNATFENAQHGLTEVGSEVFEAKALKAFPSPNGKGKLQNFSELVEVLSGSGLVHAVDYPVAAVLPGHRLWCEAANSTERFISFEDIQYRQDPDNRLVWMRLLLFSDDLSRLGISHSKFLTQSKLNSDFQEVTYNKTKKSRKLICFEQIEPLEYPDRHPADLLEDLSDLVRAKLWATVSSLPPYRRYYAYLSPNAEVAARLPQLASVYALTYLLGSITRYRPQDFSDIQTGKFGSRVQDFVTGQPTQFLYLIASEIIKQDIARPSII